MMFTGADGGSSSLPWLASPTWGTSAFSGCLWCRRSRDCPNPLKKFLVAGRPCLQFQSDRHYMCNCCRGAIRVRGVRQLQQQGRERLAQLLSHAATEALQEDLEAATFSPATLSMPLGEWLHRTGIELGAPIPREVAAFVQGNRVQVPWLPPPASPPVAETPKVPRSSRACRSRPERTMPRATRPSMLPKSCFWSALSFSGHCPRVQRADL